MDCNPPHSSVHGIFQARILWSEVKSLSHVRLFVTPWTVTPQAPWSMGFSRHEYWSGLHLLLHGIFPTQGLNPGLPHRRQTLYCLSILWWVAISFSEGFSRPRDWTLVSYVGRQVLYHWATWEAARGLWIYLSQGLGQSGHQGGSQEPRMDALGPPGRRALSLKSLVPITNQLQLCLSDTVPGLPMTFFRDRFKK